MNRTKYWRRLFIVATALATLVITLWIWRHRGERAGQFLEPFTPDKVSPDLGLEVQGVNGLVIRSNGKKQWELTAKKIRISKDKALIEVVDLSKAAYFRNEKPILTLAAKDLRFNSSSRNLEIIGNVSVESIYGLMMSTTLVRWDASRKKITCPRGAEARVKSLVFKTNLVVLFPDTNQLLCPNPVEVAFGRGGFMKADRLSANIASETVEMIGHIFCRARIGRLKVPFSL